MARFFLHCFPRHPARRDFFGLCLKSRRAKILEFMKSENWLFVVNLVTLILLIIVVIGQRDIYRRLANDETKIESLAKQQSQQISLLNLQR